MDNQTQPNIPPIQSQIQTPITSPTNWFKILLFIMSGLVVIGGAVFIGINIGKKQITNQQSVTTQPSIFPTQTVVNQVTIPTTIELNPTTNPTAIEWKKETRLINYESEAMGNKNYNLEFNYPSKWTIQKISTTHENDKLIKNCINYILTNIVTNTSVVIEPICTDWSSTYYPYPSNSEIVQKMDKQGNDSHTVYWIKYFSSEGNTYAYYEATVPQNQTLNKDTKVTDVVLISYAPDDWFFIPIKFWISAPAGIKINEEDKLISDSIIKSLKLNRI